MPNVLQDQPRRPSATNKSKSLIIEKNVLLVEILLHSQDLNMVKLASLNLIRLILWVGCDTV